MPKRKKNTFQKVTPYHCIQLWYDQGQYYEGNGLKDFDAPF